MEGDGTKDILAPISELSRGVDWNQMNYEQEHIAAKATRAELNKQIRRKQR